MPAGRKVATLFGIFAFASYLSGPDQAAAHGPCRCIEPRTNVQPGDVLTILAQVEKAIWNPMSDEFDQELGGLQLADWQQSPRSESITLFEAPGRPVPPPTEVKVPEVEPGRYLLLVLDGTEAGTHFTWDYVTVAREEVSSSSPEKIKPLLVIGAIAACIALIAVVVWLRSRE